MTQSEIDRAVARATGEPVRTIRQRGFSLADPDCACWDPEPILSRTERHYRPSPRNRPSRRGQPQGQ